MFFIKIFLCFSLMTVFTQPVFAESMAETASRMANARQRKDELEKNQVKAGEEIQDIGDLSIENFLKLEAVPEGMDAVSAQTLNGAPEGFNFMSTRQSLKSLEVMRKQGVPLPEGLEEKIKKNPDQASRLMNEAFETIPPAKVADKDDIARQKKAVIKEAESNLGIKFKDVLDQRKRMMGERAPKRRRGGK